MKEIKVDLSEFDLSRMICNLANEYSNGLSCNGIACEDCELRGNQPTRQEYAVRLLAELLDVNLEE